MFYLADFAFQPLSTLYSENLKEDSGLRNRIVQKNREGLVPKTSKADMRRLREREKTKKIILSKKDKNITKNWDTGEYIDNVLRKNNLRPMSSLEKTNLLIRHYENTPQYKFREITKNPPKVVIDNNIPKKSIEKVISTPPSQTAKIPDVLEIKTPKSKSTVGTKTEKILKKSPMKLGTKIGIGVLGTAGVLASAYGLNKLRKSRSDKGKLRGKYKK